MIQRPVVGNLPNNNKKKLFIGSFNRKRLKNYDQINTEITVSSQSLDPQFFTKQLWWAEKKRGTRMQADTKKKQCSEAWTLSFYLHKAQLV